MLYLWLHRYLWEKIQNPHERVYSTCLSKILFLVILIQFVTFTVLIFGQIRCSKNVIFKVLSFVLVTKGFNLLYSVMFTGLIWSSFFGHLNNLLQEIAQSILMLYFRSHFLKDLPVYLFEISWYFQLSVAMLV